MLKGKTYYNSMYYVKLEEKGEDPDLTSIRRELQFHHLERFGKVVAHNALKTLYYDHDLIMMDEMESFAWNILEEWVAKGWFITLADDEAMPRKKEKK